MTGRHPFTITTSTPTGSRSRTQVTTSVCMYPRRRRRGLMQSNNQLIRNAGGVQGAKMGTFFGVVNAFVVRNRIWKSGAST